MFSWLRAVVFGMMGCDGDGIEDGLKGVTCNVHSQNNI